MDMSSPQGKNCYPACPVKLWCENREAAYQEADSLLGAITSFAADLESFIGVMEPHQGLSADIEFVNETTTQTTLQEAKAVAELKPPEYNFSDLSAACPNGPVDNYAGLKHGFDATRRCGSAAVSPELKVQTQQILVRGTDS
jgi:hypothetical protein